MTKVDEIINEIKNTNEVEIMEFNFNPCFDMLREMENAMKIFINRVDIGEVRSKRTYAQFKEILGI